jgi:hypothetical protein
MIQGCGAMKYVVRRINFILRRNEICGAAH